MYISKGFSKVILGVE